MRAIITTFHGGCGGETVRASRYGDVYPTAAVFAGVSDGAA